MPQGCSRGSAEGVSKQANYTEIPSVASNGLVFGPRAIKFSPSIHYGELVQCHWWIRVWGWHGSQNMITIIARAGSITRTELFRQHREHLMPHNVIIHGGLSTGIQPKAKSNYSSGENIFWQLAGI